MYQAYVDSPYWLTYLQTFCHLNYSDFWLVWCTILFVTTIEFFTLSLFYQTWFIFHQKAQHFIKWNVFTVVTNKEQSYRNFQCVLSLKSNVTYQCINTQFHFHFIFIINKRHVLLWKVDVKLKITIWKSTHKNEIKSCSSLLRLCKYVQLR